MLQVISSAIAANTHCNKKQQNHVFPIQKCLKSICATCGGKSWYFSWLRNLQIVYFRSRWQCTHEATPIQVDRRKSCKEKHPDMTMKECMKMIINKRTTKLSSIERTLARSRLQRMKKIKVMKERKMQQRLGERNNKGQRAKKKDRKRRGKGRRKKKNNKGQRSGQNILTKKVQNRPRTRKGSPATRSRRPHPQQPVMRNRNAAAKFRSGRRPKRNYHQQKAMYEGQHPIDYVLDYLR